jgi:archaellum component FlaG (FlaF/FlaG flagellin family)
VKLKHKIALLVVIVQTLLIAAITIASVSSETEKTYDSMTRYAKMVAKVIAGHWIGDLRDMLREQNN